MCNIKTLNLVLLSTTAFSLVSNITEAQDDAVDLSMLSLSELTTIKVTASRTGSRNLQDVPMAVTAFFGDQLSFSVIRDIRDIAQSTPGMTVSQNVGYAQIYMRGVGSNNVFAGTEPSTAMHIDGVYIARPQGQLNRFQDVDRIEILRGPQGSLYGRNSTGGTINIISREVNLNSFFGDFEVTAGNYGKVDAGSFLNIPLKNEKLGATISARYSYHDGYRKNVIDSGNDIDSENFYNTRAQFRLDANEKTSFVLRADYVNDKSVVYGYQTLIEPSIAPIANSIEGDYSKVALSIPAIYERENGGVSLEGNIEISDGWNLKSISAYRENDFFFDTDTDATELEVLRTYIGEKQNQSSQEFLLQGNLGNAEVMFGAFFFKENIDMNSRISLLAIDIQRRPTPDVKTVSKALFSNVHYTLTEQFSIDLGGRYNWVQMDYDKNDALYGIASGLLKADLSFESQRRKDNVFTPRVSAQFKPSSDVMIYASASKGFKGGGFNFTAAQKGSFKPEILWAYEAGVKMVTLDNKLQLNAAAFLYDYKNLQVLSFIVAGTADITNAATAHMSGIEVEMRMALADNLFLSGNVAYLNAYYNDYRIAPISGGSVIDASDNMLNNAPRWSGSIALDYQQILSFGEIRYRAELGQQSRVFFTADNNDIEMQKPYGILNGFIEFNFIEPDVSIEFWARNILNQQYLTATAGFPPARAGRAGPPATFGIRLKYKL